MQQYSKVSDRALVLRVIERGEGRKERMNEHKCGVRGRSKILIEVNDRIDVRARFHVSFSFETHCLEFDSALFYPS